jgi:DNA (cytosine-5)-methyltransferase 1
MKIADICHVSLFDGIGCFPLGCAQLAGIEPKDYRYFSAEIMPFLKSITSKHFPLAQQLGDVSTLDPKKFHPDLVCMGTPCTGFSVSGDGEGLENIESKLFSYGVDFINESRPKYFIWENVFGAFSANKGREYRSILDEFKRIGYDCVWTTLDMQYCGIPQRRRRVYLIGYRDGIPLNHDVFEFYKRSQPEVIEKTRLKDEDYPFDFKPETVDPKDHYAFFNRQRSDRFKAIALSSTLAKRDYKSYIDLVVKNGRIRRITPTERLRLQGLPDTWFDHTYETVKSDKQRFQANGMAMPAVKYVLSQLGREDMPNKKDQGNIELLSGYKKGNVRVCANSAFDILRKEKRGKVVEGAYENIPLSGHMRLTRDEEGAPVAAKDDLAFEAEYLLLRSCAESTPTVILGKMEDFLLDEVDDKYYLTQGACEGMLKREIKSGIPLPKKLKEAILHYQPVLKDNYL